MSHPTVVCRVCGRPHARAASMPGGALRPALLARIREDHPAFGTADYICRSDLDRYRVDYVRSLLEQEKGDLTSLEAEVIESLRQHETIAADVHADAQEERTFGQRLSDGLARFGGSWTFLILFAVVLAAWITVNTVALLRRPFDPYPYILLNLLLSCLAAIQAPIIMMSQRRQEARDRIRAEHDYRVNLKAELEIRHLHEKIDHLLSTQWERLVEIQQIQIELLNEIRR